MSDAPKTNGTKIHPDPHVWVKQLGVKTTADVEVPKRLIDQVIGQEEAVAVAHKSADQKRHLMLIGDPGTGKSMLAKAMAEVLPAERQEDVIVYANAKTPNEPKTLTVPGGQGRLIVQKYERKARRSRVWGLALDWTIGLGAVAAGVWLYFWKGQTIYVPLFLVALAMVFLYVRSLSRTKIEQMVPKLLIEHGVEAERAPYVEATGAHAGALLGDVRHDPYQSGGLETPPHQRVEVGAIHRAHKGVLFVDEINTLRLESQQHLLSAMQDKKFPIVGQSQSSAGAMIRTQNVSCDFILVAAGNLDAIRTPEPGSPVGMHPALRSRIRGYGYEVYVNHLMDDTHENRMKLVQFVAQEVVRDGKIPHFEPAAVAEIIREGQRRSGRTGKLTLRLRELGGMVRTAGDFARAANRDIVTLEDVRRAKGSSRSLEQQIVDQEIAIALADQNVQNRGTMIGVANGLGVIGTGEVGEPAGIVIPVEAAVVPALSRSGGTIVIGPALQEHTNSGVENVGAVLKLLKGAAIADYDIHVDATIRHPKAGVEGIGIAAAVSSISALESLPVRQDIVMAGSVAVSGELRPVRASLQRIESGAALGYKFAIVPASLEGYLLVDDFIRERIQILYCATLGEVLEHCLDAPAARKRELAARLNTIGVAVQIRGGADSPEKQATVAARAKASGRTPRPSSSVSR